MDDNIDEGMDLYVFFGFLSPELIIDKRLISLPVWLNE